MSDLKVGTELRDKVDGDLRYVVEVDCEYIRLTGYSDFCTCESWYLPSELEERFTPTGRIVDFFNDDLGEAIINCECKPTIHIGGSTCTSCEG